MATLPPSRRGRKNLQPTLLDYDRKLDANRYDPETNPQGIADLGRSQVDFMREELASWLDRNLTPSELSGGESLKPSRISLDIHPSFCR